MKVLVTGANGLLATHTIKHLLDSGYSVKGMIRDKSKFLLPTHPKLELVQGDIRDKSEVENAVQNCNYVVHIAALTSQNIKTYEPYYEVNVAGTLNLQQAALKHKVKKFIFVSSANTKGFGSKANPGDETKPIKAPFSFSHYAKSKLEAEKKLLSASDKIQIVLLNPTFMLGAYDAKPSSGRIILMGHRKIVFYPPGGKNFVNAADVAAGVSTALRRGKNKESYLMAGENMSYKTFFKKLKNKTRQNNLLIKIPAPVLIIMGYAGDFLRKLGIRTAISSMNMKILCVKNYYSNRKAREGLGMKFHSIDKGIDKAIVWFRENGKIDN